MGYKPLELANKVAVVVGGSSGIGKTIALGLAQAGADVVASARRIELVNELASQIESLGRRSLRVTCDVTDRPSLANLLHECVQAFGKVDILVNAAGITKRAPSLEFPENDWNQILDTNLTGILRTCQTFGRHMIERRYGRIINIASVVGVKGNPGQGNYAAAKAGMIGMSKSLAGEVASRGITVNCIAPGFIASPMTDALTDKQREAILASVPMGRLGVGAEIGAATVYLASAEAAYITGQTLHVNGGMIMI